MCLIFLAPNSWGFWPLIRHMGQRRAGLPGTCPAQQLGSLSRKDTDIHPGLPVLPTFLSSSFGQQSTMVQKRWALCPLILSDQNFPRILASFCPHHPQNSLSRAVSWRGIKKKNICSYYFQNIIPITNTVLCSRHVTPNAAERAVWRRIPQLLIQTWNRGEP